MTLPQLWLIAFGPLALAAAGWLAGDPRMQPRTACNLTVSASVCAFATAVAAVLAAVIEGTLRTGTLGWRGIGFGLYLDALGAIMFVLVAFIGVIVVRFSRNYLQGDPGQGRFLRWLCFTLAAVLVLVVSGNLLQLLLAWIATSLSLHRLLLFYPSRHNAVLAARKKFVVSRLGDLSILVAMVMLYQSVGSLDYSILFRAAGSLEAASAPSAVHVAAFLLVIAGLLKSAQFPLHGWLTEVMETPTPVSALLHAGIINAGGFLVLRFAGLIQLSTASLDLMVLVGGATALFGSMVMLTQPSVKVSLAYSTIAQMGFMMFECGLGAFSAALLHIVTHSFYKAHAFLSSGSVIDLARASWSPSPGGQPHPARTVVAVVLVLTMAAGIGLLFGASISSQPGVFALAAVLLLGLTHLMTQALDERPSAYVLGRVVAAAGLVACAYFGLQRLAEWLMAGSLPGAQHLRGPLSLAVVTSVVLGFAVLTVMQGWVREGTQDQRWLALHVHLSNGLYVNTLANRLALRLWPTSRPRRGPSVEGIASNRGTVQ